MRRRGLLRAAVWTALLMVVAPGGAEGACTISSTGVSFGVYDVLSPLPTDSTGSVVYDCDPGDANIRITLSTGSAGTFTPRGLENGGDQLFYNLYQDAALTSIWGDGTGGSGFYFRKNPHPVKPITLTIYGRVPPLQDAAVGTYSDTVIVTVDF